MDESESIENLSGGGTAAMTKGQHGHPTRFAYSRQATKRTPGLRAEFATRHDGRVVCTSVTVHFHDATGEPIPGRRVRVADVVEALTGETRPTGTGRQPLDLQGLGEYSAAMLASRFVAHDERGTPDGIDPDAWAHLSATERVAWQMRAHFGHDVRETQRALKRPSDKELRLIAKVYRANVGRGAAKAVAAALTEANSLDKPMSIATANRRIDAARTYIDPKTGETFLPETSPGKAAL